MKLMKTVILACLFTLVCTGVVLAQTTDELVAVAGAVGQAIDDHDIDAILSHFVEEDPVFYSTTWPAPMVGSDQIRGMFELLYSDNPDWGSSEEERGFAAGNVVVKEHASVGTTVTMGDTPMPWVFPHIDIFEFEGDKVKRLMTYGDYAGILVQFGLVPVPETPDFTPSIPMPDPEPTGLSPLEASADNIARWNSHDAASLAKVYDTDLQVFAGPLGATLDRTALTAMNEMYFAGFPDANLEVLSNIDLGDGWIVTEILATSTHQGAFMGVPPMGYPTETELVWLMRYNADGLLVEGSFYYDGLKLMTQMTTPPYPLDGIWITSAPTPMGNWLSTTTYVAQDAAKTQYSGSLEFINVFPLVAELYPDADPSLVFSAGGQAVMVGRNKYEATYLTYNRKFDPDTGIMEIVGMDTLKAYFEVVGPDQIVGSGTASYYMAAQDADQDGFPDEGQDPVVCSPFEWTCKRLTVMPGCTPPPGQ